MNKMTRIVCWTVIGLLILLVFANYSIVFWDVENIRLVGIEDGPLENMGALAFFIASLLFFALFIKSAGYGNTIGSFRTRKNIFYLGLGILFFVAFGEEISWGQRIFGWDTPDMLLEINAQGETNLHNIPIIEYNFKAWQKFEFICLIYFVLIPLINILPIARKLAVKVALPVPPLWISLLFTTQFFLLNAWSRNYLQGYPYMAIRTLKELEECNWAIIILIFAGVEYLKISARAQPQKIIKKRNLRNV